jgi:hypothetical protein
MYATRWCAFEDRPNARSLAELASTTSLRTGTAFDCERMHCRELLSFVNGHLRTYCVKTLSVDDVHAPSRTTVFTGIVLALAAADSRICEEIDA